MEIGDGLPILFLLFLKKMRTNYSLQRDRVEGIFVICETST